MRSVAAGYESAIAASCVKIAEIYDIELADGTVVRRTSHTEDIVWGASGYTYYSSHIGHGAVQNSITGEVVTCPISWSELDSEPYLSIHKQSLTGSKWTIKRILWNSDYAVGWEITIFVGSVNIEWDSRGVYLEGKSVFGSLNVLVPRDVHQDPCNRTLFDDVCALTRADYAYSGTATGGSRMTLVDTTRGTVYMSSFDNGDEDNPIQIGDSLLGGAGAGTAVCLNIVYDSTGLAGTLWYAEQSGVQFVDDEVVSGGGNTITIDGTPAEDTSYHELGEVEILGGDNAGQIRPVLTNSVNTVTVFWPFISDVQAGDTYKLYPGCSKAVETCDKRFGNSRNWRGFATTPGAADAVAGSDPGRRNLRLI